MRRGSVARFLVLSVGLAPFLVVAGHSPAAAQAAGGSVTCRASALSVLGIEPITANVAGLPCTADSKGIPALALGVATVGAISATTQPLPVDVGGGTAKAQVAGLDLPLLGIHAGLVSAEATVVCEAGQPRLSSTSQVLGLTVAGSPVAAAGSSDVALPIGVLHLNHRSVQGDKVVVRALWLETALGQIVVGEAQAGFAGAPCPPDIVTDPVRRVDVGTITIVVEARPPQDLDFLFNGDLGTFLLTPSLGTDRRSFLMPPGAYDVFSLPQTTGRFASYWYIESGACVDPDGGSNANRARGQVTIDLDPGEEVVCTIRITNDVLAATGGDDINDPTKGVDPPVVKTGTQTPTQTASIVPPPPPEIARTVASSSGFAGALILGLVLLVLLGSAFWFLLAGAGRRREQEAYA